MAQDSTDPSLSKIINIPIPAIDGNAFAKEAEENEKRRNKSFSVTLWFGWVWLAGGVVTIFIFAITLNDKVNPISSSFHLFAQASLLASAAGSLGGLIGFLFGIPRTLAPRTREERDRTVTDGPDLPSQTINTNLEDISDWLTKILVGVGLVEFQNIIGMLEKIGIRYKDWMGNSELAVLGVIINFSVWGFFSGYLFTRLFLTNAFSDILSSEALRQASLRNSQLQKQNNALAQDKSEIEEAKNALESATSELQSQKDFLNKVTVGMTLSSQGKYDEAGTLFEELLSTVEDSTPELIKQTVQQGSIFNSLYKTPPEGFEEAIRNADRFLASSPDRPSAIILAYKGFAYGQKYTYELAQGKDKAALAPIRNAAYESIKKALEISGGLRDLIRSVWDPPDLSADRDLACFKDDGGFIELLGDSEAAATAGTKLPGRG